ncbi:hypothetical protein V1505DRAFT_366550 [Lipomyces doorenjongii]
MSSRYLSIFCVLYLVVTFFYSYSMSGQTPALLHVQSSISYSARFSAFVCIYLYNTYSIQSCIRNIHNTLCQGYV